MPSQILNDVKERMLSQNELIEIRDRIEKHKKFLESTYDALVADGTIHKNTPGAYFSEGEIKVTSDVIDALNHLINY